MGYLLVLASGVILGAIIVLIISWIRSHQTKETARQLVKTVASPRIDDMENILGRVKDSFHALFLDTLSKSIEEFLKLATQRHGQQTEMCEKDLEEKKKLLDQTIDLIKG